MAADRPNATFPVRLHRIEYAAAGTNLFEFRSQQGVKLPSFSAGAHIDLHLTSGLTRQYSLVNSQDERHRYVLAVKRDRTSRGGSSYVHERLRVGDVVEVGQPRNNFPLREDVPHSVFIAGGIGITPIACMIRRLRTLRRSWQLHYSVRHRDEAAFVDELAGDSLHLHVDAEQAETLLDIGRIVREAGSAHLYCCGPAPMLDAFERLTKAHPAHHVHLERFSPVATAPTSSRFTVELARTGRRLSIEPGQTILEALRAAGMSVEASCEQGICGTCETRVIAGDPDHRDSLLSEEERAANDRMMICCSGSRGEVLVLDL